MSEVPPNWLEQLVVAAAGLSAVDLTEGKRILRAALLELVALPLHFSHGLFVYTEGVGYVASQLDFSTWVLGVTAYYRILTDDQGVYFQGVLNNLDTESGGERSDLWALATKAIRASIGEDAPFICDHVAPKAGKYCGRPVKARQTRCDQHLAVGSEASGDFLARIGELITALCDDLRAPTLKGLGPHKRGDEGGSVLVCGLCTRAILPSEVLRGFGLISAAFPEDLFGFKALGAGDDFLEVLDDCCKQLEPTFCLTCALHRPGACCGYTALHKFCHGIGNDYMGSTMTVTDEGVALHRLSVALFDPTGLVPHGVCERLGLRMSRDELMVHGIADDFWAENFSRNYSAGLSPAQAASARRDQPRRRDEHMAALADAALRGGAAGLLTPGQIVDFASADFSGPPASVAAMALRPGADVICLKAGCGVRVFPGHQYCGRTHAMECLAAAPIVIGGADFSAPPATVAPASFPAADVFCLKAGCGMKVFPGHQYCGRTHAMECLAAAPIVIGGAASGIILCRLAGCRKAAWPGHLFCGKTHADADSLLGAAPAMAAVGGSAVVDVNSHTTKIEYLVHQIEMLAARLDAQNMGPGVSAGPYSPAGAFPFGVPCPIYEAEVFIPDLDGFPASARGHASHVLRYMCEDFMGLCAATLQSTDAKRYGVRMLRVMGVDRLDLHTAHDSLLFTIHAIAPVDQHELALGDALSLTSSRRKVGQVGLSKYRDYCQARMKSLVCETHERTGVYSTTAPGYAYRIAVVKTMCLTYQLLDAVTRYLMETAPVTFLWPAVSRFLGIFVATHLWQKEAQPRSMWAQISEIALRLSWSELQTLSSPPVELHPLTLYVANNNMLLLQSQHASGPPASGPTAPRGDPFAPAPAPAPPRAAAAALVLCGSAGCLGYGTSTKPAYSCTHVFTVPCSICHVCHARTGPRKWTCRQAKTLSEAGLGPAKLGAAFKVASATWLATGFAGADPAAQQAVISAGP